MWRTACLSCVRRAAKTPSRLGSDETQSRSCLLLCHQSLSSSSSTRPRAEKRRRRLDREEVILSARHQGAEGKEGRWSKTQEVVYRDPTPPGMKKDISSVFPSSYSPEFVESSWYEWWEKEGFFRPEHHDHLPHRKDQTFSLCIPPPNVTGSLHLGHALTVAVEDALVRWRRMQGCRVLWVPGCDHAGIATQAVVERRLLGTTGKRRQDFTRNEFLQEVWKWKNEKGEEIYRQLRRLGASLDWSRARFTMDPGFSRAVTEAFVRLSDSGLIYRSEGLVNWSCALQSAISDIEVDWKDLSGKTSLFVPGYEKPVDFGSMFTFAYPVEGLEAEVIVSTTRPETMLGDVAVAVHPDDPRYQAFHGKQVRHPFTSRLLPIITDPTVDMELGTGAMKVTPAHDHVDFLLSQRHSLPHLSVIEGDGMMSPVCGSWLQGVRRFDARKLVVDALAEKRLFRGEKSHVMALPVCSRTGDIIEPLLKMQWFMRCNRMAERAMQAVEDGELQITPPHYAKTWRNWLSNISDWCISRQLWWGHRIPAYQVQIVGSTSKLQEEWVWGRSEEEARRGAASRYGIKPEDVVLTQDPDVLDTWFSSGLFPFAMLGWPDQTPDLKDFYPNSLLETGSDLIFFWVARMVMLGTELTGQLPFRQVLFHPLVRDKYGRKMSKSLGNVIDPLDVIQGVSLQRLKDKVKEGNLDPREQLVAMEAQKKDFPKGIPQCGTDALRFALCSHRVQGEDICLSVSQVLSCRHFCNKMWQTLKFSLGVLGENSAAVSTLKETVPAGCMERWICSRLYSTVLHCERAFEAYELHAVTAALYSFWVHNLCDVYMECVKPVLAKPEDGAGIQNNAEPGASRSQEALSVLFHCVSVSLTLLSPFMPFITEELWQRLQLFTPTAPTHSSLCMQPYPQSSQLKHWHFSKDEDDFLLVQEVIRVARSLRAQCGLTKEKPSMWVVCSPSQAQVLLHFSSAVQTLGRMSSLQLHCPDGESAQLSACSTPPPEESLVGVVDHTCRVHLHLQDGVNVDNQILQLSQKRDKLVSKLEEMLCRLQSPDHLTKVPAQVRQQMDKRFSALKQELKTIEDQLELLQKTQGGK